MNKKTLVGITVLSIVLFISCGIPSSQKKETVDTKQETIKPANQITVPNEIISLDSGLKYQIIKQGSGTKTPYTGDRVTVHYAGWIEKNGTLGKKFDSSVDRGQKFTFTIGVSQVIKGWDEGVMGMKLGEKRRLFIPSHLGYGERGIPGIIPPKSTLIFDVELFAIE